MMLWILQRSMTLTGNRCTFSACLAIFNTGANIKKTVRKLSFHVKRSLYSHCSVILWLFLWTRYQAALFQGDRQAGLIFSGQCLHTEGNRGAGQAWRLPHHPRQQDREHCGHLLLHLGQQPPGPALPDLQAWLPSLQLHGGWLSRLCFKHKQLRHICPWNVCVTWKKLASLEDA